MGSSVPSFARRLSLAAKAFPLLLATSRVAAAGTPGGCRVVAETFEFRPKTRPARTIRVLVPPGYAVAPQKVRKYPVLFLNDGYNVFDPKGWDLPTAYCAALRARNTVPWIIVGVDSPDDERARAREYLPYPDESLDPPLSDPLGKSYPDFLIDEVIPEVARRYRVASDGRHIGVGGASYGSYVSLYAATARPGRFGRLLLESTPLFIQDFRILDDAAKAPSWPRRVWIGVGGRETGDPDVDAHVAANAERLASVIRKADASAMVKVFVSPEASHGSPAWRARLPEALRFLMSPD